METRIERDTMGEVAVPGRIAMGDEVRVLETVNPSARALVAADGV